MKHKAEGRRQHQIKSPGYGAPVEKGVNTAPVRQLSQGLDIGIIGIKNPFSEGIKEDIRCKSCGKHHTSPGKKGVFRLFVGLSQNNIA